MTEKKEQHLESKVRSMWWWLIIIIGIAVVGYGWWQSQNTGSSTPNNANRTARGFAQKTPVRVNKVVRGTLEERLFAVGTAQAFNTIVVRSRVEGELIKLNFKDGEFVQAGTVLAEIDPRPYQAKLEQAQGQLAQTMAQLKQARTELERFTKLQRQQSIAQQQVDNQRAQVQQLEGALESAKAAVTDAETQLAYTQIASPIDGRLGLRQLDEGNLISAANTEGLVVITQTQPIAVSFALPEQDLQRLLERLALESELPVHVYSRNNKLISTGAVLAVDNRINENTGTIRVKASMPNLDNRLFPNQFVSVSVLLGTHRGLIIPNEAIQIGSIGDFVYVMNSDDTVSIRPVQISLRDDKHSLIESGLELGDQVVVEGTDRLREGSNVEPISPSAPTP